MAIAVPPSALPGAASPPPSLLVRGRDRAVFVGMSGSGKTYAAGALSAGLTRFIACDSGGQRIDPLEWDLEDFDGGYRALRRGKAARLYVPAPVNVEEWDDFLNKIYECYNCTMYIDELYAVGPPAGSEALRKVCTRGRARGIGSWFASQRPSQIPLFTLSEANHFFCFQLQMEADQKRMAGLMGGYHPGRYYRYVDAEGRLQTEYAPPLTDHNVVVYNSTVKRALRFDHLDVISM